MVKGVSRRVIVVKSPDPRVFEEAIFVIRDDFMSHTGLSERQIIKEAQKVADGYISKCVGRGKNASKKMALHVPAPFVTAAGAATGIAWLAMRFVGV